MEEITCSNCEVTDEPITQVENREAVQYCRNCDCEVGTYDLDE